MPWTGKMFLRTHGARSPPRTFFSAKALTLTGLVRYPVLFVTDLGTRFVLLDARLGARPGGNGRADAALVDVGRRSELRAVQRRHDQRRRVAFRGSLRIN